MRTLLLLLAGAGLSFAQLDPGTLTITAVGQPASAAPDHFDISVSVISAAGAGLDDVLGVLPGSGITGDSLTSLGPWCGGDGSVSLIWGFTISASFSALKSTLATLDRIQAGAPSSYQVSYWPVASSGGGQTLQACQMPALLSDAQAQAQKIASAAGLKLGPIVSLSDGSAGAPWAAASGAVAAPGPGLTTYPGVCGYPGAQNAAALMISQVATCVAVVQFQLLH